jgi:hypothetical protein
MSTALGLSSGCSEETSQAARDARNSNQLPLLSKSGKTEQKLGEEGSRPKGGIGWASL